MSGGVDRPAVSLRKEARTDRGSAPGGASVGDLGGTVGTVRAPRAWAMSAPAGSWDRTRRPLFGDRWPGPAGPPPRAVLAAAGGCGLVAALAVPTGEVGVGWLATAAAGAAAVGVVRWRAGRLRPAEPADLGWAALAVALAAVSTVRAAPWLAALCLLAAAAAAALAVAGRSFRGLPASLVALPIAALRALPWVGRGLRGGAVGSVLRTAVAGLVGLGLLAVFVPLLAAADAAFLQVVEGLLPSVDGESVSRGLILFMLAAGGVAGAGYLLLAPPEPAVAAARATRLRLVDWALPTGLLVALFTLFVGVQFVVLFGSDDYVLRTTGLTYAEYARQGFWQLLAVTVLTLGVLAGCSRWAPSDTPVQRAWKRGLLGTLANLTLIIVVSAVNRMWLYQEAYGFTVLRLLVLTCELWLGVGFVLALVAVLRLRPAGLTRPMLAAGMLALLGLAVLDPERFIAQHNVARWSETGRIDVDYLGELSADAVPPLLELPEPLRSCALAPIARSLAPPGDWRDTNLAQATARTRLAEPAPTCPTGRWPG